MSVASLSARRSATATTARSARAARSSRSHCSRSVLHWHQLNTKLSASAASPAAAARGRCSANGAIPSMLALATSRNGLETSLSQASVSPGSATPRPTNAARPRPALASGSSSMAVSSQWMPVDQGSSIAARPTTERAQSPCSASRASSPPASSDAAIAATACARKLAHQSGVVDEQFGLNPIE